MTGDVNAGAVPARSAASGQRLALALMAASGFASLGYQIVWTQQSAIWLGHETAGVLAVVAAFFGGLAFGAAALGSCIERSAHPARWYAACEATIAAWSVVLVFLFEPLGGWLLERIGVQPAPAWHWTAAFCGTFVLLLPATAAMGATLPAMERVLASLQREGYSIAALYASNTLGAVIGVLACAFWLVPAWGLARTTVFCAAINLVCAAATLAMRPGGPGRIETPRAAGGGHLFVLVATGLLGIGYEVLVVRVLSQVAENTVYTFAMLLAVYLAGTALGAAAYQRWLHGSGDMNRIRAQLFGFMAFACMVGALGLWGADAVKLFELQTLGPGMGAALAVEASLALAAFGAPTLVMGALFSHLTLQARSAGVAFSRSLAFNTLGAAVAPLVFGVLLIPAVGAKFTLLMVAGGYLALLLVSAPRSWRSAPAWVPASGLLALALWAPPLIFVDVPKGGHVVSYNDGAMAAVSVVEDGQGVMRLRIDNRQQEGSSNSRVADARQALLPLLLHPAPKRALFLGLGTGVTAFSAAQDSSLQVDAVELLPEVIAAAAYFRPESADDASRSRLHTIAADARRYVRASSQAYDVIVSDNFHPARSGSGALYTVEHFQAVRKRLAAGGLFCQWLPLHQLDLQTLRAIVQSFITVYPDGLAMIATNSLDTPVIGLVGRAAGGAIRLDAAQVRQRIASAAFPYSLADVGLPDEFAVLGSFIAGPASLARFAAPAKANTDDRPVVAYSAPRITYVPDSLPRDRLVALLGELAITPGDVFEPASDAAAREHGARMAAYWSARTHYIAIGRDVRPSANVQNMLAQVRGPLLTVLHSSPEFRPAYDPLLMMATALARVDSAGAKALLVELSAVQPARTEAALALQRIGGATP